MTPTEWETLYQSYPSKLLRTTLGALNQTALTAKYAVQRAAIVRVLTDRGE